jgi:hypothetical protein
MNGKRTAPERRSETMHDPFEGLRRMIDQNDARRERDKERYEALTDDECQLCGAAGPDKRTLRVECFYAVHEAVPEAIDMHAVDGSRSYLLRVCKACRGRFLGMMADWRSACLAMRSVPKDSDGCEEWPDGDERCTPVRENGAIKTLTLDGWKARNV